MADVTKSHRIEVDRCEDCSPFRDGRLCKHPVAVEAEGGYPLILLRRGEAVARFCPLLGSVTMIAGPALDFSRPTGAPQ